MVWRGTIFDMDGVIVDTVPIHFRAWKRMFADYGHDFTFDEYKRKVDGIPRTDGAKAILTSLSEEEIKKAASRKQEYFLDELNKKEIPIYNSTLEFIDDLKKNDIKVAVISSSKNAPIILERIGLIDRLDAVVSGHDITKGKPDPQIFLMAAEKLSITASEAVVVEDAILGIEAAKRASMICIGVDRYNDPSRLEKADLVISDLREIDVSKILEFFIPK